MAECGGVRCTFSAQMSTDQEDLRDIYTERLITRLLMFLVDHAGSPGNPKNKQSWRKPTQDIERTANLTHKGQGNTSGFKLRTIMFKKAFKKSSLGDGSDFEGLTDTKTLHSGSSNYETGFWIPRKLSQQ